MSPPRLQVRLHNRKPHLEIQATCEHFPLVVLGPSGAGKTTLLECLAGLRKPDSGRIICNGRTLLDSSRTLHLPSHRRGIGYVMQDHALFPHLSVRENVLYAVRWQPGLAKSDRQHRRRMADALLEELGISHLSGSRPLDISGGERTRVALARALISHPVLLLLDEPFNGLDPMSSRQTQQLLVDVIQQHRIPTLLVTHDRAEALALGRWMWLLLDGHMAQEGAPETVFQQPSQHEAAAFLGVENLLPGEVVESFDGLCRVRCASHVLSAEGSWQRGTRVYLCVRPEDVVITDSEDLGSSARNRLSGTVVQLLRQGHFYRVTIAAQPRLHALLTREAVQQLQIEPGRQVFASFKATAAHLIQRAMPAEGS